MRKVLYISLVFFGCSEQGFDKNLDGVGGEDTDLPFTNGGTPVGTPGDSAFTFSTDGTGGTGTGTGDGTGGTGTATGGTGGTGTATGGSGTGGSGTGGTTTSGTGTGTSGTGSATGGSGTGGSGTGGTTTTTGTATTGTGTGTGTGTPGTSTTGTATTGTGTGSGTGGTGGTTTGGYTSYTWSSTPDTAAWDECDWALHVAGWLDNLQTPNDGRVLYCHSSSCNNFTFVDSDISSCLTHVSHNCDIFPTTLCDS